MPETQSIVQLLHAQLKLLLEQSNFDGAKALLVPAQPIDIAEAITDLPEAQQAIAFRLLTKDEAIEVFEYFETPMQEKLLDELKAPEVQELVNQMSPDDRAMLFDELPAKVVTRLLNQLSPAEREATALILNYPVNTAGRIMTTEYVALKENFTVMQAFDRIRSLARDTELVYYLYVTNASRQLTGIVSLRELVTADPEQLIGAVMTRDVVSVMTTTDQEEVARLIKRYDFLAVPVVDQEKRLVGIITVDDVLDILEAETTEDIYRLGGVEGGAEDDYFESGIVTVVRRRVTWLLVLLITNSFTGSIMKTNEEVLQAVVTLAVFVPLLIDTGGNIGAQSSTVVIRGLGTDALKGMNPLTIIGRELLAGGLLGLMLGAVTLVWAMTLIRASFNVALVVALSLVAISLLASLAGATLPYIFARFKQDPAIMSAPIITTMVDVLGVLIYFMLARLLLSELLEAAGAAT